MSKNAIDAAIIHAYSERRPVMMIPSRRQVEAESHGGGYVEGWNTQQFASYVRERDPQRLLLLCRDHGGPYQHPCEVRRRYSERQAMQSAAESLKEDIRAGFDLVHLDTSADLTGAADVRIAMVRAVDLYEEIVDYGRSIEHVPRFEIGFEAQGPDVGDPVEFESQVDETVKLLMERSLPMPAFMVAQTGTKVVETFNVGHLKTAPLAVASTVRKLAAVAARYGIALKAHNCDYLKHADLSHLINGHVDAVNIAPELGVVETKAFVSILQQLGLTGQLERFLELAYESHAWRKWMRVDSGATAVQRAVIAGHYVYNTSTFREIKASAQAAAGSQDIDSHLRRRVLAVMESYARPLAEPREVARSDN